MAALSKSVSLPKQALGAAHSGPVRVHRQQATSALHREVARFCTKNSVGRPFDIARSNYVVADYHTELVQIIIALELADLGISDY